MKKTLLFSLLLAGTTVLAQQRYLDEVADVTVTKDVTFATNIDFLKNSDFSNQAQVGADLTDLKTLVATGGTIPAKYYDPADTSTVVKVSDLKMDIYEPAYDVITDRPVVLYLHTGNFLPPGLNGQPNGSKADSSVIVTCTKLAKRGFVAVAINYRLGWNPLANDPVTGPIIRRATLLNAVYRALHDAKECVRVLKDDAVNGSNTYGIDPSKITVYGEGSGGYVALAYATLDKVEETEIPKFVYPGTVDSSYVQPGLVGDIEGFGGLLNLYVDNGQPSDIHFTVNAGGALADTSWLEAGDVPMVAVQCVRDPFAPFGHGTVIVPTTLEDVVDVQGANLFMDKANTLGNNTPYTSIPFTDPYTMTARAKYGATVSYIYAPPNDMITIGANIEGTFPVLRPKGASLFQNEGGPWQWWDPNGPTATIVINPGPPPITTHMAGLQSNPDMSSMKGRIYTDTILNYAVPRIVAALGPNTNITGIDIEENTLSSGFMDIYPNPTKGIVTFSWSTNDLDVNSIVIRTVSGQEVLATAGVVNKGQIDISGLPAGLYMIDVKTTHGSFTRKLIKE